MYRNSRIRIVNAIALAAAALLVVVASAFAADSLSRPDARDKAQSYAGRNHCETPCSLVIVRQCDRVKGRSDQRQCKAKTRSLAGGGDRICKGKVRVTRRGSRLKAKSIGWDCR